MKAAGLKSIGEAKVQADKKGDFYVAVIEKPGRPAIDVIGEILPDVIRNFPWPKSMRWGASSFTWVRPLRRILCLFAGEIVPFALADGSDDGHWADSKIVEFLAQVRPSQPTASLPGTPKESGGSR